MADNREYMTYKEELGSIQIADEVVGSIAAGAAMEIEGVSGLSNGNVADLVSVKNKKLAAKGIRLEKGEDGAAVLTVCILVRYGCNVGDVGKKVQNAVYAALEGMTGLKIGKVNVHVGGISFN